MKQEQIDNLIIAGDLFNQDQSNVSEMENLLKDYPKFSIHIIPGNHDENLRNSHFTGEQFHIYEQPIVVKLGNIDFGFIPYQKNKTMGKNISQIQKEYKILKSSQRALMEITPEKEDIEKLFLNLKSINLILWDIEDKIRVCEKNKDFSKKFIELARNVYINNDKRAKIKSELNKLLGSNIKEVKKYADY